MTFKEVGNEPFDFWNPQKDGDSLEGTYTKKKEKFGSNKSKVYFLDCDGQEKAIWGSTVLDDKMDYCQIGEKIRITFKGYEKNYQKFMVEKDSEEISEEESEE